MHVRITHADVFRFVNVGRLCACVWFVHCNCFALYLCVFSLLQCFFFSVFFPPLKHFVFYKKKFSVSFLFFQSFMFEVLFLVSPNLSYFFAVAHFVFRFSLFLVSFTCFTVCSVHVLVVVCDCVLHKTTDRNNNII